jgi:hypothetical protein
VAKLAGRERCEHAADQREDQESARRPHERACAAEQRESRPPALKRIDGEAKLPHDGEDMIHPSKACFELAETRSPDPPQTLAAQYQHMAPRLKFTLRSRSSLAFQIGAVTLELLNAGGQEARLGFTRACAKDAMTAVVAMNSARDERSHQDAVLVPKDDEQGDGKHEHRQGAEEQREHYPDENDDAACSSSSNSVARSSMRV